MVYKTIRTLFLSALAILFLVSISVAGDVSRVKRVVDEDTLLLSNREYVRLIGVDTPETRHPKKPAEYFGKEAYFFTGRWLKARRSLLNTIGKGETSRTVCLRMST